MFMKDLRNLLKKGNNDSKNNMKTYRTNKIYQDKIQELKNQEYKNQGHISSKISMLMKKDQVM